MTASQPLPVGEPNGSTPSRRALLGAFGLGAVSLAVAACTNSATDKTPTAATDGSGTPAKAAFPVTITHRLGETVIPAMPKRILALGQTDCDPLIALGIEPIAIGSFAEDWYNPVFPWNEAGFKSGKPTELNFSEIPFEKILALKPDLVTMVSGGISEADYKTLSKACPVIGPPVGYQDSAVPYGPHTELIGKAVGMEAQAKKLVADVDAKFKAAREANPEWASMTAIHAECYTGKFNILGKSAPRTTFLTSVGFQLPAQLMAKAGDNYSLDISAEELGLIGDLDLVCWNTDPGALDDVKKNPVVSRLDVVEDGHAIWMTYAADSNFMWSMDWATVLSAPYALQVGVPLVKDALAGGSPTAPGSA